ncbi:hypothetical protein [Mycoplasma sp. ATU-Cv-508]
MDFNDHFSNLFAFQARIYEVKCDLRVREVFDMKGTIEVWMTLGLDNV